MDKSTGFFLVCMSIVLVGCDQIGEQASKAVEKRVQDETSKLVDKALGSVDKTINAVASPKLSKSKTPALSVDKSLNSAGIAATSLHVKSTPEPSASVYLTFSRAEESVLEARFSNHSGEEIGRSRQKIRVQSGDGKFVEFPIDPRTRIEDIRTVWVRKL